MSLCWHWSVCSSWFHVHFDTPRKHSTISFDNVLVSTITPTHSILCMRFNDSRTTCVLGREDGSLELWRMNPSFALIKVIPSFSVTPEAVSGSSSGCRRMNVFTKCYLFTGSSLRVERE